jgi:hypothetical protein
VLAISGIGVDAGCTLSRTAKKLRFMQSMFALVGKKRVQFGIPKKFNLRPVVSESNHGLF